MNHEVTSISPEFLNLDGWTWTGEAYRARLGHQSQVVGSL